MANAWGTSTDLWLYNYTEGVHMKANKILIDCKLRVPEEGKKVYEEVAPNEVKEDRNHVVIHHREKKVKDSDIPQLAMDASHWNSVTRLTPNFSEEMFVTSDLMYRVEPYLNALLNNILETAHLMRVQHVMQAINMWKNKSPNGKESKALRGALQKFFKLIGGTTSLDVLMAQWTTCRDWQRERVSFAHPLNLVSLQDVKNKISSDEGFAEVREIALIMVNFAIKNNL